MEESEDGAFLDLISERMEKGDEIVADAERKKLSGEEKHTAETEFPVSTTSAGRRRN